MPEKFLSIEELPKRLILLKDAWYAVPGDAEKLSSHRSGFEPGFKKRVKGVKADLERFGKGVEEMGLHLKHHFPRLREEIDKSTGTIAAGLKDFEMVLEKDLSDLDASAGLEEELGALQKKFEDVEKGYKKAELRANEACGKYFETKSSYTLDLGKVKRLSRKNFEKVTERYSKDMGPLAEGCEIMLGGEALDAKTLFERLFEEPKRAEEVSLVAKAKGGLLAPLTGMGRKEAALKPRLSVLRYVLQEALKELARIKDEEERNLLKVEAKYSDFKALGKACTELEERRKKLEEPRKALLDKMGEMKKGPALRFADYDGVLETREGYLKRFNELNEKVKPYLSMIKDALEGYESFETDVEKRELMEEIERLKEEVEGYRAKLSELKALHEELKKRHEEALQGLEKVI